MAVQFEIKGNFFNVKDIPTSTVYINDTTDSLKYYRTATDVFSFYPKGASSNTEAFRNITKVGEGRNEFPFADIIDARTGLTFTSADDLDLYLAVMLGALGGMSSYSGLQKIIIVNQSNVATTLGGTIDSSKEYFIDGVIDMGTTQITVPTTGMTLRGYSFDISGLISSEDNYTMFISESTLIGSGNVLGADYYISVTGASSKVYELVDATGFNAFEFSRINYIDCTDLGEIANYRQGLEDGTGRFGGSPSLTLHGLWRGGYRITTSIVRSLAGTMTAPLFKEGVAFQMNSRFLTDINCDLPTLAPLCDFTTGVFPNPSTVQIKGAIISRDGSFDANDTNILPNLLASDLPCDWDNNIGIPNTFVGGAINTTAEVQTNIVTQGVAVDLNGTFTPEDLQHFDSPSNGRLRHIGVNPREYTVNFDFILEGVQNSDYELFLVKSKGGTPSVEYNQIRVINNLQGSRDVAYFSGQTSVILNQNEYMFWQVANLTGAGDCTLELDSTWTIKER